MAQTSHQGEIRSLTGLRGAAACYVMAYHYLEGMTGRLGSLVQHGYIAVDLFFVLSGFVMALTYRGSFAGGFSWPAYESFLSRRLGRVYPLYIIVTLAAGALAYVQAGTVWSGWSWAANVLMVQSWGLAEAIGGPAWSISTEFGAYLIFPLLVAALLRGGWRRAWLAAAVALLVLVFVATRSTEALKEILDGEPIRNGPLDVWGDDTPYPLLRCLGGFSLGLLAFRLTQVEAVARLAARRFAGDAVFLLVLVGLAVPGSDVGLVVLFVPLVIALAAERSLAAALFRSRVPYWLGVVSYSIYLMHRLVDDALRHGLAAWLTAHGVPHGYSLSGAVLAALVLVVSAATYYGIEKPARDWMRRLSRRFRPAANPPGLAATRGEGDEADLAASLRSR